MADSFTASGTQIPVEQIPNQLWDAVVIGAGPAGSICALHLARGGAAVLLVDRADFPREKVCGDGLIADALKALDRAGLLGAVREKARTSTIARLYSPARICNEVAGEFLTLPRIELDAITAAAAKDAGAVMALGEAVNVSEVGDEVAVDFAGLTEPVRARVCVVATGARMGLMKKLGLVTTPEPYAMAVRCYVRSTHVIDELIISHDRSILPGYGWIFPMKGDLYNVGCGAARKPGTPFGLNLRTEFEKFVAQFPPAKQLMDHAIETTPLKGAPLRSNLSGGKPVGVGPVLCIGEAIGSTFPFSGEGIGKAMETGEIAAELISRALAENEPAVLTQFGEILETRLRAKYLGYQTAEKWLSSAFLADLVARRAQKSAYLQESMAGVVNETVDPQDVFSLTGVLKSLRFWK
jgi:geranylgeranyl reductase family protein